MKTNLNNTQNFDNLTNETVINNDMLSVIATEDPLILWNKARKNSAEAQQLEATIRPLAEEFIRKHYPEFAPGGKFEGCHFIHLGHEFCLMTKRFYNYSRQSADYRDLESKINYHKEQQKILTAQLSAMRPSIRQAHPYMEPIRVQVSLQYYGPVDDPTSDIID